MNKLNFIVILLVLLISFSGCAIDGAKKWALDEYSGIRKIIEEKLNIKPSSTPVSGTSSQPTKAPKIIKEAPNFIEKWGEEGVKPGQFFSPLGIAIDNNGNIYIADTGNFRIQKFTSKGKYINAFGKRGSDVNQLDKPYGLVVSDIGDIYISDNQNSRIVKISSSGEFLSAKCNDGDEIGELHHPVGLSFDNEGYLYVADTGNHRIQRLLYDGLEHNLAYSKAGKIEKNSGISTGSDLNNPWNKHFSKHNEGPNVGQFSSPWSTLVLPSGDIVVVDTFNHRIQKFASDGTFITQWGTVGMEEGQFQFPTFAALDQYGFILVADTGNHRIQKFTQDGEFLASLGVGGYEDGQFNQPHGIAVNPVTNDIYIVDSENNRIEVFSYKTQWELWYEGITKKKTPTPGNMPTPDMTL